jgi:DNA-binding CsgD family transcriptional regulator
LSLTEVVAATEADRGPLTRREREVAALVASGATNRGIADALVLTEGTVANHVRRILLKLGLRTRTQLAVWSVRHADAVGSSAEGRAASMEWRAGPNEDGGMDGLAERVVFVVGRDRGARGALTGTLVRELGVQAVSMSDGDGTVAWARVLRPTLVLVDARALHDGAADLVRRLRADPATAGTAILAVGGPPETAPGECDGVLPDAAPGAVIDAVRRWLLGAPRPGARPRTAPGHPRTAAAGRRPRQS